MRIKGITKWKWKKHNPKHNVVANYQNLTKTYFTKHTIDLKNVQKNIKNKGEFRGRHVSTNLDTNG